MPWSPMEEDYHCFAPRQLTPENVSLLSNCIKKRVTTWFSAVIGHADIVVTEMLTFSNYLVEDAKKNHRY
jgi:hypothetical protein